MSQKRLKLQKCEDCRYYPKEDYRGAVQWPCAMGHTAKWYQRGTGWLQWGEWQWRCEDFEGK